MWISYLVAQAGAHLSINHPIIINANRKSSVISSLTSIRGGASSESSSRSSWTAGSKYNYGAGSKSYNYGSNPGTSSSLQTPSSYSNSKDATNVNEETKEKFAEAFLQRDDRNRFIGKLCTLCVISFVSPILTHTYVSLARVYAILSIQLLFTAATIHAFHLNPGIRNWMMFHPAGRKVPLLGLLVSTITWWITLGSENIRQSPWPLLLAFTAGESLAVGFISSIYAYSTVIKAMVTTAASTLSITIYTLMQKNPKYDLTQWGRGLASVGFAFLMFGIMRMLELFGIIPYGFLPYSEALYCIFGAGLFSMYLAYHTRLIVSGKSAKYQMSEKDYILGAMSLYSDIINIFLYILRLLGELDDRD